MKVLLNSGGKDSNYFSFKHNFLNIFIMIKSCKNFIDFFYSIFNCKNNVKKLIFIDLNKEYYKLINIFFKIKKINIDFYCNKLIKIYLIKKIFRIRKIFSGHYFRNINNIFCVSIDQKKDQSYFLNFKNNIFSNIGFLNKNIIKYISIKNNFICKNKKNTTGICFNFKKKYFFYYFIIENNMILNIIKTSIFLNLGKIINLYPIIKIKNNIIYISKYKKLYFFNLLEIENFHFNFKIFLKTRSAMMKKIGKIIFNKKKTYILLYKKQKFIDFKNVLIFYNDLIISNLKIKKMY
ncbi:tRNA (5-methylaminomethyl-2-thiouridylate)-methyltransferase [Candidatus Carsonella ruddii]|uniref:tRNA (5-methylaminomethyl-2-thiouridylate)-methyltransferase n=1 Tax=Carsonella ruddii TaxID=114186 RepID=UPI00035C06FF|nr:tRNA (5-methylaminomethyl-2-thiouridylate)-methyltransferase [Candidatus Carsonella ruddii]AGS06530.1 tRNA (5-methylaminomethyl-2-thiouridylate)-methyltransferase [Candidatus Carsonella ruddii DC]ALA96790.1 hypothetical protein AMC76_00205 [Candidatus Carsonella ruddii]